MTSSVKPVCLCGAEELSVAFTYDVPPKGEVRFMCSSAGRYARQVWRCAACGHFLSTHDMDMDALYQTDYVTSTYGDGGLRRVFDRIVALDPAQSDNVGRVERLRAFAQVHFSYRSEGPPSILDVGSGLCVFLHRIKTVTNWRCTALDPDPRSAAHAREYVGVNAICGDFMHLHDVGRYDIVTFNKVLEHVLDPVAMLHRALGCLNPGGVVYVEVPDGEGAFTEGAEREEFFIDHHHIFSHASVRILAARAGFVPVTVERLREPSSKFTVRAFLVPVGSPDPSDP